MQKYFVEKAEPFNGIMPALPWCVVSAPDQSGVRDVISEHATPTEAKAAIKQYADDDRAMDGAERHYQAQYAMTCGYAD